MHMLSKRTVRVAALSALTLFAVLIVAGTVSAARTATSDDAHDLVGRRPQGRRRRVAGAWGAQPRRQRHVVQKDSADPRRPRRRCQADNAPDVIVGAHDWTGAAGRQRPRPAAEPAQGDPRPVPALHARLVLVRHRRQAALRRARRVENIGLVVNTKLAKVPKTFAELEQRRWRSRRRRAATSPSPSSRARTATRTTCTRSSRVCAATSSGRTAPATSTRPTSASRTDVPPNAPAIDRWNRNGLINSKVDDAAAQTAFLEGRPRSGSPARGTSDRIRKAAKIKFQVVQVPSDQLRLGAVPRRAGLHGHEVRADPRRRERREGPRRQLHDGAPPRSPRSPPRTAASRPTRRPVEAVDEHGAAAVRRGVARAACRCRTSRRWRASGPTSAPRG